MGEGEDSSLDLFVYEMYFITIHILTELHSGINYNIVFRYFNIIMLELCFGTGSNIS